jgi:protoheme IX farnesyltransferase
MWTPPHFWALALLGKDDYQRAGVPMLPVTAGASETRRQILVYSLILIPIAFLPALLGIVGGLYIAGVAAASAGFLWFALKVFRSRDGSAASSACRVMFSYSIFWLFVVFALILIERMAGFPPFQPVIG